MIDLEKVDLLDKLLEEEGSPNPNPSPSEENKDIQKTPEELATEAKTKEEEDKKAEEAKNPKESEENKEPEEESEEDEEATTDGVLDGLIKRHGITLQEGKVYEESEVGLDLLVNDIAETKAKKALEEHLKSVPGLEEFYKFVNAKGNPAKYFELASAELDYEKLDIKDEDTKKRVVKNYLIKQGLPPEEADKRVIKYEASGLLDDEATSALSIMQKEQKINKQQIIDAQIATEKAERDNTIRYWNDINKTLTDKASIAGISIPVTERKALFEYMALPVDKEGRSKEAVDIESEDYETRIAMAYLRMKKIKLPELVAKEAETKKATEKKMAFKNAQDGKFKSNGQKKTGEGKIDPASFHDKLLTFEQEQEKLNNK